MTYRLSEVFLLSGKILIDSNFSFNKEKPINHKINHEVTQVSCHKRGHAEKRSHENIQEDYDKFVADGSVTSRQKFYHNVIHEKLLDIELDKVRYKSLFYCFEEGLTGHLTKWLSISGLCSWTSH